MKINNDNDFDSDRTDSNLSGDHRVILGIVTVDMQSGKIGERFLFKIPAEKFAL